MEDRYLLCKKSNKNKLIIEEEVDSREELIQIVKNIERALNILKIAESVTNKEASQKHIDKAYIKYAEEHKKLIEETGETAYFWEEMSTCIVIPFNNILDYITELKQ